MSLDRPPISGKFQEAADSRPAARHEVKRPKAPPPFSLRLTAEERAELLRRAGRMSLGAYIRAQLLEDTVSTRRALRKPVQDDEALARLLGELGKGRLSSNLNQLAKAANCGALPVTPETEQAIDQACRDVRWMRDTLIAALGLKAMP